MPRVKTAVKLTERYVFQHLRDKKLLIESGKKSISASQKQDKLYPSKHAIKRSGEFCFFHVTSVSLIIRIILFCVFRSVKWMAEAAILFNRFSTSVFETNAPLSWLLL